MWVKLVYKTKAGNTYRTKKDFTIKKATALYKRDYENDDNIVEVYLTHFGIWRRRKYKTLKEKK